MENTGCCSAEGDAISRDDKTDCVNSSAAESKRGRECILDCREEGALPNKKQAIEKSYSDVSEVIDANTSGSTLDNACCQAVSSKFDSGSADITSPSTGKSNSESSSSISCSAPQGTIDDSKPSIVYTGNGKLKIKLGKNRISGGVTHATTDLMSQNKNDSALWYDASCTINLDKSSNGRDSSGNGLPGMADRSTSENTRRCQLSRTCATETMDVDSVERASTLEEKELTKSEDGSGNYRKNYTESAESLQEKNCDLLQDLGESETVYHSQKHVLEKSCTTVRSVGQDVESKFGPASCSTIQSLPLEGMTQMKQERSELPAQMAKSSLKNGAQRKGKKRDNDLHRLLFMPNGLADGTWLGYCNKGETLLEGRKQGNGIFCRCCNAEISPSQFEAHAGWATRRQPYRNIYTSDGLTLHDLSLSLAKELATASGNDGEDKCTQCGNGGKLLLCTGRCGLAFHEVCLGLESVPKGKWYCPRCNEKCGSHRKAITKENSSHAARPPARPLTLRLRPVVKPQIFEVGGCVFCGGHDFSAAAFNAQTVLLCDQCEKEFHVGCLKNRGLCDLQELPKGKWFCSATCNTIHADLENRLAKGQEIIPAFCIERKYGESMSEEVRMTASWQLLSGKYGSSEQKILLSKAAAIFRGCFDPIVEKSGRDLVPAMVYGRNVGGQDFGGMFCAVLTVNSNVVSAGIFRIFGIDVAELPLVATSKENQGKGYFKLLFSSIGSFLRSLNVKNLILPAAAEAKSIWTDKFGFREMTDDRLDMYSKHNQIALFQGTTMLEKSLSEIQV